MASRRGTRLLGQIVGQLLQDPSEADVLERPAATELHAFASERRAELLDGLTRRMPTQRCWSWSDLGGDVGWVARRQTHEALIHRAVAELAGPGDLPAMHGPPHAPVVVRVRDPRVHRSAPAADFGGHATISVQLVADADGPVPVVVEYLIHYLGVRGHRKPKAYRLAERILEPGVPCDLRRRQRFAHASIRRLEPGEQLVELQVNGRVLGSCTLELEA